MNRNGRKYLAVLTSLLLTACGGSVILIDKDNQESHGSFNTIFKSLEVNVKGKTYSGYFITNATSGYSYGSAFSGTRWASGSSQYVASGNSGRAVLRARDGSTLTCEFNYQSLKAIGICKDRNGEEYQLITD